ncbi:MAG: hypothetical protein RLZZ502_1412, partial [Pseudomonadota bacterium]
WLLQRVSAVVMAVYSVALLVILLSIGTGYAAWSGLFANAFFKIFTFVALLSLYFHAWVGIRDLWMDYIKPAGLRLTLHVLTALVLLINTAWTIHILWGMR